MRTLKLTLKKEWFDMILSGKKKEEYREIKPHWIRRLYGYWGKRKYTNEEVKEFHEAKTKGLYSWILQNHVLEPFKYDCVEFTNGYGKDKPQVTLECQGIRMGIGNPDWGASSNEVFIIKLGKELNRKNINNG